MKDWKDNSYHKKTKKTQKQNKHTQHKDSCEKVLREREKRRRSINQGTQEKDCKRGRHI